MTITTTTSGTTTGPAWDDEPMPVPRARLVGRAHELGELTAALDDVRSGANRTFVIAG
jgi:hypothetical protein